MNLLLSDPAFLSVAAGVALWTPAEITTALWLDADDANTITESGGAVSQWNDKSGNGSNATAFNNPTYNPTGLSTGMPSIAINGSNQYLRASVPSFNNSSSAQVFFVFQTPNAAQADTATERLFAFGSLSNAGLHIGSSAGILSGEKIMFGKSKGGVDTFAGSSFYSRGANSAQILSSTFASSGISLRADGSTVSIDLGSPSSDFSPANTGFTSDSNLFFGANVVFSTVYANIAMQFSEIIVLNSTPSLNVAERLEGYLAHKWGLTANLPAGHPYKSAAPTA